LKDIKKLLSLTIISFVFISFHAICFADLLWPLKEKSHLTGSFAEFRKNHIHAGVDISTKGKTGLGVYASESGYLFRLKTQYLGFGKAIYIKLDNSNFLVYAHLNKFSPKINKIIKAAQKKEGKYKIDLYLKDKIYIKKGELIGYTGDTGGVPPHLHIELRDSNERPLNILKNGLEAIDKKKPIIHSLAICDPVTTFHESIYRANNNSPIIINGKKALALYTYDESSGNKLGIYQIDVFINNKLYFRAKMDIFSYDDFKDNYIIYNKDLFLKENNAYYNLFKAFDNNLPFYPLESTGILNLPQGQHNLSILVTDNNGNESYLEKILIVKDFKKSILKKSDKGPWFSDDNKLKLEIDNLYSPININIKTTNLKPKQDELKQISKVYDIIPKQAIFKNAIINIENVYNSIKIGLYRFDNGKWKYVKDNSSNKLGKFCLFEDITPPKISIISKTKAKITDNGSGLDYNKLNFKINNKSEIAEYSVNRKELFTNIKLSPSDKATWSATDLAGNNTIKDF